MIISVVITTISAILAVLIHYEFLAYLSTFRIKHRFSLVYVVLVLLLAHTVQVILFALVFYVLYILDLGSLMALGDIPTDNTFIDFLYFSFTTFSTLGYGDLNPLGEFKLPAGLESLLGFVLITWSASFLFFEMQRHWKKE